jgi:hypothetical protein
MSMSMKKNNKTPSTQTVMAMGFDVTLPCGTTAALNRTGYSRQEVRAFAKHLGIPVHNRTLDCLCGDIRAIVLAKDAVGRATLRNTSRNMAVAGGPAQTMQPAMTPGTYDAMPLSPAATPMPLAHLPQPQPQPQPQ